MNIVNHLFSFSKVLIVYTCLGLFAQGSAYAAVESRVGRAVAEFDVDSVGERTVPHMVEAAKTFIASLDDAQKKDGLLPVNTPERSKWSNLPPSLDYGGIRMADMSDEQLQLAVRFMGVCVSPQGFNKIKGAMLGDDMLVTDQTKERGLLFGADNFWFFIFGDPDPNGNWGWQIDGHHLGMNMTFFRDQITLSPSFIGAQPADVQWGDKVKFRPMGGEVDKAFKLVQSLDGELLKAAVQGERRQNLEVGPGNDAVYPKQVGIRASQLNQDQKELLSSLISEWTHILPEPWANRELARINKFPKMLHFGWWGETTQGSAVYYRIQGPTVIIEFSHQNLGGNPSQHLHSVYRNPSNDYGLFMIR